VRELENCDKMILMKINNEKINKNYNENIKRVHMNCFVYSLTHPHAIATGLVKTYASFST